MPRSLLEVQEGMCSDGVLCGLCEETALYTRSKQVMNGTADLSAVRAV